MKIDKGDIAWIHKTATGEWKNLPADAMRDPQALQTVCYGRAFIMYFKSKGLLPEEISFETESDNE